MCRRMCGQEADAADATQEALIAVVRGLPRFDGRSSFSTWSYRVATNAALDELRRRSRRPVPVDHDDRPTAGGGRTDGSGPIGGGRNATDAVADRLDIDAALDQLPTDFRVAVVLRDVCTLDYAEIAEVLDLPPGTVRSRIARGRRLLADLLDGNQLPSSQRPTARS